MTILGTHREIEGKIYTCIAIGDSPGLMREVKIQRRYKTPPGFEFIYQILDVPYNGDIQKSLWGRLRRK